MFVIPRRNASAIMSMAGALAFGACSDPVQRTDLRPPGPPEVLTVLAMNDSAGLFVETATFCKVGDDKRPGIVGLPDFTTSQVCDDDLTKPADEVVDAVPTAWYARIEFDRLLDPAVEDLIPNIDPTNMMPNGTFTGSLAKTQPVTFKCGGVDVPYDGYYSPSGNNVTWPLGPSLFLQATDLTTVATGSECEITIKDVVKGKNGNPIDPDSVGGGGKFKWKIAPLALLATDPVGDPTAPDTIAVDSPVIVTFNGFIKDTSIDPTKVKITTAMANCTPIATGPVLKALVVGDAMDPTSVDITLADNMMKPIPWVTGTTYVITFAAGATATDVAGGPIDLAATGLTVCFSAM